ncbi:MAG: DUF2764 domain-containing protein [Kiritimatiellaeota bacterium]|nr:DUF2764 domain-containing protein [Kiritimatiellota bacterium]
MSLPYLLASLPYLHFDAPAPINAEAFVAACRAQLSEKDAAMAEMLLYGHDDNTGREACATFFEKETLIRNAIARCRSMRRGKDPELATKPASTADVRINNAVDAAFQLADPAARDTALERLRWDIAEEFSGVDPMMLQALFGYAAKLRICLRRTAMTQEAGAAIAKKIFNAPLPEVTHESA